jgi:hypothetical protein
MCEELEKDFHYEFKLKDGPIEVSATVRGDVTFKELLNAFKQWALYCTYTPEVIVKGLEEDDGVL